MEIVNPANPVLDEQREGDLGDSVDDLTLELSDDDVARIIGNRVEDDKKWWDAEIKLTEVREKAEKYYMGQSFDEKDLYDFQIPYKDPEMFIAIETLVPLAVSNAPMPVVTEASDSDISRQLAGDFGNVLLGQYEDLYLKAKLSTIARHLLLSKRLGILKYWWDPSKGKMLPDGTRKGGICVEAIRGERIVISKRADANGNPDFIAHFREGTVEELISKYPDKKDAIFKECSIQRGVRSQLQKEYGYIEVWFSYYDKKGNIKEAVAWKLGKVILGKDVNPNWNYDGFKNDPATGKAINLNFFDSPQKPFIFFNHLNLGKYIYDDTSFVEQAASAQDLLNKRGRQIVENADQASSGLVLNSKMMSMADADKIIGDPTEKLMVDGPVQDAAARLPYTQLPSYVLQDKQDARNTVSSVFGANAAMRGDTTGNKNLGQDVLSQRAQMGRLQSLADSLEDGMDKLYKALAQMIKVYWDEPELITLEQASGKTQFITWSSDKIQTGVKIRVKAGSMLPKDKFAIRNETIQTMAILDPLSIAEGLDKPNPKEFARRIVYYRFFMDKYLTEILGDSPDGGIDNNAIADIHALTSGMSPTPPDEPSKDYLYTIDKYINSGGFANIKDETIKNNITAFAQQVTTNARIGLGEPAQQASGAPVDPNAMPQDPNAAPPQAAPEGAPAVPPQEPASPGPSTPASGQPPATGNILQKGMSAIMSRLRGK